MLMMDIRFLSDKKFLVFCARFLIGFLIFYFGTRAIIGLSSPSGNYSPFVAQYLDFVTALKKLLIYFVQIILTNFCVNASQGPEFRVGIVGGKSVIVSMSCVGYIVYSVWIAYVIASDTATRLKWFWVFFGLFILFFINCIRITAFLYTYNKGTTMPLGLDHHTWFNLLAYLAIFVMIYFYEQQQALYLKRHQNA